MIEALKATFAGALLVVLFCGAAAAQAPADETVVGLLAGGIDGTDARIAADLAAVMDDEPVRVMPLLGRGSEQALGDLLSLPGVDVAILQSDVLSEAKKANAGLKGELQYVAKLYNEELHVLARADIARIEDLAGKPVGFGPRGSGTSVTGAAVFDALKIGATRVSLDDAEALEKLRKGELAALLYVAGRPAPLLRGLRPEDGLHLLSLPLTPELLQTYVPSRLTHDDYPPLLRDGESVDTVAVGAVMAVPALTPDSGRYRGLARFVEGFFAKFPALLEAPHHPKWREVNLSAKLPGWTRFPPAEEWLRRNGTAEADADPQVRRGFEAFLDERAKSDGGRAPSAPERDVLFEQFLRWRQARQP